MILSPQKVDGFAAGFVVFIQDEDVKPSPSQSRNNCLTNSPSAPSYDSYLICHHSYIPSLNRANDSPHDTSAIYQNRLARDKRRRITRQKYRWTN